jgi:hypothetical protein
VEKGCSYETDVALQDCLGVARCFCGEPYLRLPTFKSSSPEVRGVREAMNAVHFQFMGTDCSYGGFYIGFGLLFTAYLLFSRRSWPGT